MPSVAASISSEPSARPPFEVADVFRLHGSASRQAHRLPVAHLEVMSAIERCRPAALGGHVDECEVCGHQRISYNSCRNRHCPKCQANARRKWVAAQNRALLPVEYFDVVFTLPDTINALLRWNRRLMLNLLFTAVSETLLEFGERHLKGEPGITAVLHTWGQTLVEHPHLHCIVTGGALAKDGSRFTTCPAGYLFPVRALAQVFRGKYCDYLRRAYQSQQLHGTGAVPMLASNGSFADYLRGLRAKPFVVYAKRPFAGPDQVIGYVGRYTHRIAISNRRLLSVDERAVSFQWKDYRDAEKVKAMTLDAHEFIRRFLLHVLPPEFVRIRHYGILANGRRKTKLEQCRALLQAGLPSIANEPQNGAHVEGSDEQLLCEQCHLGRMSRREELPPDLAAAHWKGRALNLHYP